MEPTPDATHEARTTPEAGEASLHQCAYVGPISGVRCTEARSSTNSNRLRANPRQYWCYAHERFRNLPSHEQRAVHTGAEQVERAVSDVRNNMEPRPFAIGDEVIYTNAGRTGSGLKGRIGRIIRGPHRSGSRTKWTVEAIDGLPLATFNSEWSEISIAHTTPPTPATHAFWSQT